MIPLPKLRRMRNTVATFAAAVRPYSDGSWDDNAGGWSDKDEASRSLTEAWMYLDSWVKYRERHHRDPKRGELGH